MKKTSRFRAVAKTRCLYIKMHFQDKRKRPSGVLLVSSVDRLGQI